jgi:hypothetical protein
MIHMIRQQYVHVELHGTESEGLALQRRLPDLCHHWLTPAIEQALERCAPPDGYLSIERLEIDVGTLTLEHVEHDLPEMVALALEQAIREQVPAASAPSAMPGNDPVQHKTAQQSIDEAFIYFLETGSLPWSFRLPEGNNLEQAILHAWREAATSGATSRAVHDAVLRVLASAAVRQRLIWQFSPVFLETLLALLSPEAKSVVDRIVPALRHSTVPSAARTSFEKQLWEMIFAKVAAGNVLSARRLVGSSWRALPTTAATSTVLASVLEHHWPGVTRTAPAEINRIERTGSILPTHPGLTLPSSPESEDTPSALSERPEAEESREYPAARAAEESREYPEGQKAAERREHLETQEAAEIRKHREAREAAERRGHPEAREGMYIENAGLVLLHPFLPRFFAALDIANEDELLQPERALCLLHFLTTGQPMAPEYALILPKILCNIPLLAPVETDLDLRDTETEEAVALLEAVIRHWEVLRNTSPDGLRGTFLLRSGKVSLRDDGDWLLQVESNSVDILLDQLPWGISMIKLPWMDKMLWVEWR